MPVYFCGTVKTIRKPSRLQSNASTGQAVPADQIATRPANKNPSAETPTITSKEFRDLIYNYTQILRCCLIRLYLFPTSIPVVAIKHNPVNYCKKQTNSGR